MVDRYYRISFAGKPRQHVMYSTFENRCAEAYAWLKDMGRREQAADIYAWMHGPAGFTRAHMPYYVTLTASQWDILSNALRKGEPGRTQGYTMALTYGKWVRE